MFQAARTVIISACVSALVAGAVVGTHEAFGSNGSAATTQLSSAGQSAADQSPGDVSAAFQAPGRVSEMNYVPIANCTLVDTARAGGRFANGTTRSYDARGAGSLAAQGGNAAGCKLPENAAVIALNVRPVEPLGTGSVRIGPVGGPSGPIAVNYRANQTITGFTDIDLGTPSQPKDFKVTNSGGPTHMVIGVVGYFIAPMGAFVDASGATTDGSRVVSSARPATGNFTVVFDRDVRGCFYNATGLFTGGIVFTQPLSGQPNGVFVIVQSSPGVPYNGSFYITVTC